MQKVFQPLVSIVILNWNGIKDTKLCLEHIKKQTYTNYEVIVVDNGSRDDSLSYLESLKDITLVKNKNNHGFTGGHIDALQYAKGDYILLLNNDAVTKPDLLEKALLSFTDPSVAVVGGRAYFWNKDNPLLDESNDFYNYQFINPTTAEAIFYREDFGVPEEVNNVSGSCVMIRKDVIDKLGYLDNDYFAYYEEADLFARYKRAGYKIIYDPGVQIWHKVGASSAKKSSTFMLYMLFRNRFFFAVRQFDNKSLRTFLRSYVSFGIKCTIKNILKRGDQSINKPFMRALLYNTINFPRSFVVRRRINNKLGQSNYITKIKIEQTRVSHLVSVSSLEEFNKVKLASKNIPPSHEIIIATDNKYLRHRKVNHNTRVIYNKGFFDTHIENLAGIVARYDWITFNSVDCLTSDKFYDDIKSLLKSVIESNSSCAYFGDCTGNDSLDIVLSRPILIERDFFLKFHGIPVDMKIEKALGAMVVYMHSLNKVSALNYITNESSHIVYSKNESQYIQRLTQAAIEAQNSSKPPRFYEPLFTKFYRLQQIRFFLRWLLSPKIGLRIKAGRTKGIVVGILTLNKKGVAFQLKHIRTEILLADGLVKDLSSQQTMSDKSLSYLSKNPENTTVFIICRDRLSPLLELLDWLSAVGMKRIVLIDNDSAYPDFVEYLANNDSCQILEMRRNAGHTVAWSQFIIPILVPNEYYIVTDPDVIPVASPEKSVIKKLFEVHKKYKNHLKVGFGLKIDDLPDTYSLKQSVIEWESQFWIDELEPNIFEAGVDTTFALYKPFVYHYTIHPSIRIGEPFTARHLPWYADDKTLSTEDIFYKIHADQNVNTWNKGKLPDRYLKELKKIKQKR